VNRKEELKTPEILELWSYRRGKNPDDGAYFVYSGKIHKTMEVPRGGAQMDWMERNRNAELPLRPARWHWHDCTINIIDTPVT
jgi:hypothetical protein